MSATWRILRSARDAHAGILRRLRGREDAVAFALLVEIAAFLVAPALHLVNHRADHTHGPGGVVHTHDSAPQRDGAPSPAPFHGDGDALHFALAITSAPVFIFATLVALALIAAVFVPASRVFVRELFDVAVPRGPPIAI
jgi:hypothetical protein